MKSKHQHASHDSQLPRLKRAHGQVAGVIRMVEEGRYCMDILSQLKAARAALRKVELEVLREHAEHCIQGAAEAGHADEARKRLDELMRSLEQVTR